MQKSPLFAIASLSFFFVSQPVGSADDPFWELRQASNEIYRFSQDMILHGSEGHAAEIVSYGKTMTARTEKLMKEVNARPPFKTKAENKKLIDSLKSILQKTNEAVALAKKNQTEAAVAAARKASFQAKQLRQQAHFPD